MNYIEYVTYVIHSELQNYVVSYLIMQYKSPKQNTESFNRIFFKSWLSLFVSQTFDIHVFISFCLASDSFATYGDMALYKCVLID